MSGGRLPGGERAVKDSKTIRHGRAGRAALLLLTAVPLAIGAFPAKVSGATRTVAAPHSQKDSAGAYNGATFALG
jgi:hypothetical protein